MSVSWHVFEKLYVVNRMSKVYQQNKVYLFIILTYLISSYVEEKKGFIASFKSGWKEKLI